MTSRRLALLLAALVALPLLLAPGASACVSAGIPCGRIYPTITVRTDDAPGTLHPLARAAPLVVDAVVTYSFDAAQNGYSATTPNEPIVISFEFPRKPGWVDMAVDPPRIEVPINDPTHLKPDASDPANPKLTYEFSASIKITVTLLGQAVLKDGLDHHKLLVFAKSTESGIFQSGYGIKEVRVTPEGAVHEADVAGTRDVYVATPLPEAAQVRGASRTFGGVTVTLAAPERTLWWRPQPFEMRVEPAPQGRMMAAVHDEWGGLVAQSSLVDASAGVVAFNVTLVRPGLHTATLTLLPQEGSKAPPATFALDLVAGDLSVEGVQFPKTMLVAVTEKVPAPTLHRGQDPRDVLTQFERDVPFYAFETAQSVTVAVLLRSPVPALATGGSNLQFSVLDPDGKLLQTASVDPANPAKGYRIGSVPVEGWYTLRVNGAGLPAGGDYDAMVEVNYVQPPQARNRADGRPDPTPPLLPQWGRNLTLPIEGVQPWQVAQLTPEYEGLDQILRSVTVTDENGTVVLASRLRSGPTSFTAPWPGTYRAFVHVQPTTPGKPFSPVTRAFTFPVGADAVTVAQTFPLADAYHTSVAPSATVVGWYALPRGAPDAPTEEIDGVTLAKVADGDLDYVVASTAGPTRGEEVGFTADFAFDRPVSMTGPSTQAGPEETPTLPIPGLAVGLGLAMVGAAAVAVALLRRRV